jgi:hypothetical protein
VKNAMSKLREGMLVKLSAEAIRQGLTKEVAGDEFGLVTRVLKHDVKVHVNGQPKPLTYTADFWEPVSPRKYPREVEEGCLLLEEMQAQILDERPTYRGTTLWEKVEGYLRRSSNDVPTD